VIPIFGDGRYKLQFVAVEDVARAFVQALDNPVAAGRIYCAAGPTVLEYVEAIDEITRAAGLQDTSEGATAHLADEGRSSTRPDAQECFRSRPISSRC
jgi:uncharacterized protein YbjT (DUF2867 family)